MTFFVKKKQKYKETIKNLQILKRLITINKDFYLVEMF